MSNTDTESDGGMDLGDLFTVGAPSTSNVIQLTWDVTFLRSLRDLPLPNPKRSLIVANAIQIRPSGQRSTCA